VARPELDLDAYFARIRHGAEAAPTLETLRRIHALHAEAIPFENLAPFLGEPVKLDIASIEDKLVRGRRGGWCFEHNLLFARVLEDLGFEVRRLAARVRWNVSPGVVTSRSHMLLLVAVEGERYVADVGFGGLTLTAPLRLEAGIEQDTPHEPHRISAAGDGFLLEAKVAGSWQGLYTFDLHEQLQADYEVSNWYLANHPSSHFVTGIIAARAAPGKRHALRNARYAIHHRGGETERRTMGSVEEFRRTLTEAFHVPLPDSPLLDRKLEGLLEEVHAP
jgi:N-hydroxyarylamine O-acetyltransferase